MRGVAGCWAANAWGCARLSGSDRLVAAATSRSAGDATVLEDARMGIGCCNTQQRSVVRKVVL